MQSRQQVADAEEGEQHCDETDDVDPRDLCFTPSAQAEVQIDGVDEPGDECPGLFWIPALERAPCIFCPDGASDDDDGEERQPNDAGAVCPFVEDVGLWQRFIFLFPAHEQHD